MRVLLCLVIALAAGVRDSGEVPEDIEPEDRTAQRPDSWLVVYNQNKFLSVQWAHWYAQRREIPTRNLFGVAASSSEHLPDLATAQSEIMDPVKAYLGDNPDIEENIMGIVVGFGVPLHFGEPPEIPSIGGYSIESALQDLSNVTPWEMNLDNPHRVPPYGVLPAGGRLTKTTMLPDHYMVARLDGPNLASAKSLTMRAQAIESTMGLFSGDARTWYDYTDSAMPGGTWYWLKVAVDSQTADFDEIDWWSFDADTEQTPFDAFRFSTHDLVGWDDGRLAGTPAGARILAFDFNSWGATTLRSTSDDGARFVPNALAAGYAAAIGATGEPLCCVCPFPDTVLAALRKGWTLGEAFYMANPYDDWMWILVGDPLLRMPEWYGFAPPGP